jgi:hypothetical protein
VDVVRAKKKRSFEKFDRVSLDFAIG